MKFQKPPLIASVLAVSGIAVLCGLGYWQCVRLAEKEAFLERVALQQAQSPGTLTPQDFSEDNLYKRGTLKGRWLNDTTIKLIPRSFEGKPGTHLYTAFEIARGQAVMVNRGWLPQGSPIPPATENTINGEISKFPSPNFFTPENPAEGMDWYRLSPQAIETITGKEWKIAAFILRADDNSSPLVTNATKPQINNNHANYAAFWFSLTFILGVMFVLRFMRKDMKAN